MGNFKQTIPWKQFHLCPGAEICFYYFIRGGGLAQSVERATPGEEVLGSILAVAAAPYWLGRVSIMWPAEPEVMVSPLCLMCGSK